MAGLSNLNLIHLFNFYLALMFVLGTYRRFGQYRAIGGLVFAVPGRWPRLFVLVRQHRAIFLTWATILPAFLALLVLMINTAASRLVWPTAHLTLDQFAHHWLAWPAVLLSCLAMIAVDGYFLVAVGQVDRPTMEKYFDEAEFWLRSWKSPVVRVFTLGYINPRRMVAEEVRKSLLMASQMINTSLWWVSVQVSLRVAFGLSLWLTYALTEAPDRHRETPETPSVQAAAIAGKPRIE